MPLGLMFISAIPTTIGVCEALSAQKKANKEAKEKAKFHLTATVSLDRRGPVECFCVLKDGHLWIDHPSFPIPGGHKFTGWYFTYPSETQLLGLVSTISDDPPMLNWIFVDKDTGLLRYGGRQDTLGGHIVGPWHWNEADDNDDENEKWLTLENTADGFVAVQVGHGSDRKWAVAWDKDGMFTSGRGSATETEESGREDGSRRRRPKWVPIMLRRRMQLGLESRYVKDGDTQKK